MRRLYWFDKNHYAIKSQIWLAATGKAWKELTLRLLKNGNPKSFKIIANNLSEGNKYIQSVTLDEVNLNEPFITFGQIMNGKNLVFEMGVHPNFTVFKNK